MKISLNGKWFCEVDKNNSGRENRWFELENFSSKKANLLNINIPMSFNTLKGYENYEGIFWHYYTFDFGEQVENKEIFIKFKGANYVSEVWLNGGFLGDNEGLIVAEIELEDENEIFEHPSWIGDEVSHDTRYYNVCLVKHPFKEWDR